MSVLGNLNCLLGATLLCTAVFSGTASAQLPDLGPCADLYQQHQNLLENAPPDSGPYVKRFRAAVADPDTVKNVLNNPDALQLGIQKLQAVVENNKQVLQQYEAGNFNVVYTDPERTHVAKDPVGFVQFENSASEAWIAFMKCRLNTLRGGDTSNCKALVVYRDTQLVKDFDSAMTQYDVFRDGKLNQEKIKKETQTLLDDQWWAGETAAKVAIEVKLYTDLFNDVAAYVYPEEYLAKLYGKTANSVVHYTKAAEITVGLVKTDVDQGAKKAAMDGTIEVLKDIAGQAGAIPSMGIDLESYNENKEQMAQYQQTVQERVRAIDRLISNYEAQMQRSQAKLAQVSDIVAAIDQLCNPPSVPVNPPQ